MFNNIYKRLEECNMEQPKNKTHWDLGDANFSMTKNNTWNSIQDRTYRLNIKNKAIASLIGKNSVQFIIDENEQPAVAAKEIIKEIYKITKYKS